MAVCETPDDALAVLLLMRSGSTIVGESRPDGRPRNSSPSGRPIDRSDTLMAESKTVEACGGGGRGLGGGVRVTAAPDKTWTTGRASECDSRS